MSESTAVASERHTTHVRASPATVYQSLWQTDFGGPVARALLAIRLVPVFLSDWRRARERLSRLRQHGSRLTLDSFVASGFVVLEANADEELVLGLAGRFWTPGGGLTTTQPDTFRSGPRAGEAQAAWNFHCRAMAGGWTELSTETRVRVDPGTADRRFRAYWFVVRPFSGLLRRLMLRAVRRTAERTATRTAAASPQSVN
jgi:hypothetical protein